MQISILSEVPYISTTDSYPTRNFNRLFAMFPTVYFYTFKYYHPLNYTVILTRDSRFLFFCSKLVVGLQCQFLSHEVCVGLA